MNIAVLASHAGTTLQAVLDACERGAIAARVTLVISNNAESGALERARRAHVPVLHLSSRTHPEPAALDRAIMLARTATGSIPICPKPMPHWHTTLSAGFRRSCKPQFRRLPGLRANAESANYVHLR